MGQMGISMDKALSLLMHYQVAWKTFVNLLNISDVTVRPVKDA